MPHPGIAILQGPARLRGARDGSDRCVHVPCRSRSFHICVTSAAPSGSPCKVSTRIYGCVTNRALKRRQIFLLPSCSGTREP